MEKIIDPVDPQLVKAELTSELFVRETNKGSNEIYIFDHRQAPQTMRELGRLREVTFRGAGGGTGKSIDLDEYDLSDNPYQQLVVWDPEKQAIVGGYRFICCRDAITDAGVELSTMECLDFSDGFIKDYLPYTIELGRSFVQPLYQPSKENRAGLFSLDNLWDGLGALIVDHPDMRYFFGKVTMYTHFSVEARDLILTFLREMFEPRLDLAWPPHPLKLEYDTSAFASVIREMDYKTAHRELNQRVRDLGENIPPLVNSYMNLSRSMKTFGTAINRHFGNVEESGIMITIDDIYDSKKERHISSYEPRS